ncbi:MAG: DUF3285 domain-containing protein [Cyanobacteriota bacterium]
MSNSSSTPQAAPQNPEPIPESTPTSTEPQPSYVKLAMRNMVRKGGTSLKHFALSTIGLVALLIGLSYLTR